MDAAGFFRPEVVKELSFDSIFQFQPRPSQTTFYDMIKGPGVYILEAPMGIGKTEAALYAAYKSLELNSSTGIYFALPTQLTSNRIYLRFQAFLRKILSVEDRNKSLLLHSNAWLVKTEMGEEGQPGGSWFDSAKRGLLAPFAVGTIDQALMAAMNVKHGFVRAFGLAGKVVILDEVHTYDSYTGTILDSLIELLKSLQCTVIILTATLSKQRRREFIRKDLERDDYPLVTALVENGFLLEQELEIKAAREVSLKFSPADELAKNEVIKRASRGEQVLWIENTISEAQEVYLDLAARASELGIEFGLLHSRFTQHDRQKIEDKWVSLFGNEGISNRTKRGRLLVGTQVLEQSLDIDADFMVTRLAPSDMLLQRLGRLWRNGSTPRPKSASCEAYILSPRLEGAISNPYSNIGATAYVYSPYVLCRTLEVWSARHRVQLPSDIRDIIESTYVERKEHGEMARYLEELENGTRWRKGRKALRQLAFITLSKGGKTLPESKAQTRYSERDDVELLLLSSFSFDKERKLTKVELPNKECLEIPLSRYKLSKKKLRNIGAKLMQHIVKIRLNEAPAAINMDTIRKFGLHHYIYPGNPQNDEATLRIAVLDESCRLSSITGGDASDDKVLYYRPDIGYRFLRN